MSNVKNLYEIIADDHIKTVLPALSPAQIKTASKQVVKNPDWQSSAMPTAMADIDIRLLFADMEYQRDPMHGLNNLLGDKFDPRKLSPIQVNYRDNKFFVIDGQHRVLACILKGYERITASIFVGMTQDEEARMFATQNVNVTKLSSLERYKADVVYGDPIALIIKQIVDDYNMRLISSNAVVPRTVPIGVMNSMAKTYGFDGLNWTFNLLQNMGWLDRPSGAGSFAVRALCRIYKQGMDNNCLDDYEANILATCSNGDPVQMCKLGSKIDVTGDIRNWAYLMFDYVARDKNTKNIITMVKALQD